MFLLFVRFTVRKKDQTIISVIKLQLETPTSLVPMHVPVLDFDAKVMAGEEKCGNESKEEKYYIVDSEKD